MQLQKASFRHKYLNTISDRLSHPLDEILIVFDRAYTSPDESDQEEPSNQVKKLLVPEIYWRISEV